MVKVRMPSVVGSVRHMYYPSVYYYIAVSLQIHIVTKHPFRLPSVVGSVNLVLPITLP